MFSSCHLGPSGGLLIRVQAEGSWFPVVFQSDLELGFLPVRNSGFLKKSCLLVSQIQMGTRQRIWPWTVTLLSICLCNSNYDLNYKLHREDVPYRVYEYQRIPPLINQVPAKIRRTHVGLGIKSSCNPHKASRNSHLAPRQMKLPTEELHSIRRALSQIKAQVDSLLESLEHMDQQDDQPEGQVSNRPRPHSKQAQLFLFLNLPEHQGSCLVLSLTTGLPYPEHTSPPLPLAVRLLWLLGCPITFAHLAPL
uniref:Uncharacterized protein LOC109684981 isoform X2 n=1 Tax=Castor canadensis TaxID=51338 RepID=A0A8B7UD60_CASCN|nr:uncharacterized protein LOC109684981 isoform X2 [Castor canadensis]